MEAAKLYEEYKFVPEAGKSVVDIFFEDKGE